MPARRRLPPPPDRARATRTACSSRSCYVADTICCQSKHGFNLTGVGQRLDAGGLSDLKIDQAVIDRTAANLDELVKCAADMMAA